jgi:NEDD8-activating enzyme E1
MLGHPHLGRLLAHPSVSHGATPLYMRGVLEGDTRSNLGRPAAELLGGAGSAGSPPATLTVNDKKLHAPLRVRLRLGGGGGGEGA